MDAEKLRDFYAQSAHGRQSAEREFRERTHGWHFELAPEAAQWADAHAAGERWSWAAEALVVHAGRAIPSAALEAPARRGDGAGVLAMLRLVVESFGTVSTFSDPPGTPRR
ncbi:hypothetical protein ABH926_000836 [Catenulispora sp. GP43]|uniref:hypothetical protein n=1 Tax=Catenulispora sp. GP43 TaxID=3156263 RepID=UPI0035113802